MYDAFDGCKAVNIAKHIVKLGSIFLCILRDVYIFACATCWCVLYTKQRFSSASRVDKSICSHSSMIS